MERALRQGVGGGGRLCVLMCFYPYKICLQGKDKGNTEQLQIQAQLIQTGET